MKKLAGVFTLALLLAATISGTALAKEKLYTFSNNNEDAVKEINYYLDQGAKVVFVDTAAKAVNSTVIITIVVDIPNNVPAYSKK